MSPRKRSLSVAAASLPKSERFYNALKGHGATARYVVLPFESHGYAARESIMHMLWEMDSWLNKYVKEASAAPVN